MAGWKSILPILGPALAVAGLMWWMSGSGPDNRGGVVVPTTPGGSWNSVSFQGLKAGDSLPGWTFTSGKFEVVAGNDQPVLALYPEPMGEGQLGYTQLITGKGGVRARMRGERIRRAFPRLSVGFQGETQYQLRTTPGSKEQVLELTTAKEQVLASVPWTGEANTWMWLELTVDGTEFQGRAWKEGEARPAAAQLTWKAPGAPGLLRAVVQGAPFAYRPIYYDRIEVLR